MTFRAFALATLAAVLGNVTSTPAMAQTCSFSVADIDFGNVDLTDNSAYDTTANYTASCTGGSPTRRRLT